MEIDFKGWPKIPRSGAEIVTITEKMDGTNGCIIIQDNMVAGIQSRKRFITLVDDNFGFANWVWDNEEELLKLGEGYHYGEWVGPGINKNPNNFAYKTFFLFNTDRWNEDNPNLPDCCRVVKVLHHGLADKNTLDRTMIELWRRGKMFEYIPEGVITYFHKTRRYEKTTFKNSKGKWNNND